MKLYTLNTTPVRKIAIIRSILESGNSVELPATGYSMFPTMRHGDKVLVRSLTGILKKGNIIVYEYNGNLVLHRLIDIIEIEGNELQYLARGDSMAYNDKLFSAQQLIGVADSFKRGKKEYKLKVFVPGGLRYFINLHLLWLFFKIERYFKFREVERV